jgi:hypothetical protein
VKYRHELPAHGLANSMPSGVTDTGRKCVTWVGTWRTDDRVTWRTADDAWLAQLKRSNSGRYVSLAIYHHGVYLGRQDASGFHLPTGQGRARRPRRAARSLPLPLAG